MCAAKGNVRFTPNSDRESRHPQTVMSALPPKADMCSAKAHVRFGPKADMTADMPWGPLWANSSYLARPQKNSDVDEYPGLVMRVRGFALWLWRQRAGLSVFSIR